MTLLMKNAIVDIKHAAILVPSFLCESVLKVCKFLWESKLKVSRFLRELRLRVIEKKHINTGVEISDFSPFSQMKMLFFEIKYATFLSFFFFTFAFCF